MAASVFVEDVPFAQVYRAQLAPVLMVERLQRQTAVAIKHSGVGINCIDFDIGQPENVINENLQTDSHMMQIKAIPFSAF